MEELTFAQLDKLEADRQAKRRECVERLAKILATEFSLNELRLIQNDRGDAIRIEAYEQARLRTKKLEVRTMGSKRPVDMPDNLPASKKPDIQRPTPKQVPIKWPHPASKGK